MASGLMTYSQFKSSRQNSMNGSSARERGDNSAEEGEFEQVWKGNEIKGSTKKELDLGKFPKSVTPPPLDTFRNPNVTLVNQNPQFY